MIVAGGIYSHADILKWIRKGANGIQMGTRFLATHESDASPGYKLAVIECAESDIVVVDPLIKPPGSPCGLPFRIIKQSPMFLRSSLRKPKCNKGYVLRKDNEGHFSVCPAKKRKKVVSVFVMAFFLQPDVFHWKMSRRSGRSEAMPEGLIRFSLSRN